MATPDFSAQDVITCDLCDKPTQQFCNSCQVSLCDDCVGKHRDEFQSLSHNIVHFLDRKIQGVFLECQKHPGESCKTYCRNCCQPACINCIQSDSHNGHDTEDLVEIYERRMQELKKETQEIKVEIIPLYQKEDVKTLNTIFKTKAKFDDFEKLNEKHKKLWHKEVDSIFDKIELLRQSFRDEKIYFLERYQSKIRSLLSEMTKTVEQNEKILKSNKFAEISAYQSKLKKYREIPEKFILKMPHFATNVVQGKELSIELEDFHATLKQISQSNLASNDPLCHLTEGVQHLLNDAKVLTTIPTNTKPLNNLSCVGEAEAWVGTDSLNITRIDKHGSVKNIVTTTGTNISQHITATKDGELIYSVYEHSYSYKNTGMVNIVKNGKTETLITTPRHWRPVSLCCTRSGDILVYLLKTVLTYGKKQKPKIVRFQEYTETQEIYLSFMDGSDSLFLAENNGGDICVSDANVKAVVVFDRTGEDKFRYNGESAMRRRSFSPGCIVTDYLSQIIVTDINNDCLHILDQNGQFLRCVDNCGLENPSGLSVDSKGRLWVGLRDSGEIKVLEYIKQT